MHIVPCIMAYVKYSDMTDSVASLVETINREPNMQLKTESLVALIDSFNSSVTDCMSRTCYELKSQGIATDIIATRLSISQRAVLRMIRRYSQKTGYFSPLDRITINGYFDIRDYLTIDTF